MQSLIEELVDLSGRGFGATLKEPRVKPKQTAIFGVVHYHVNFIIFKESVPEFDNMRVLEFEMDFYFPENYLHFGL